MDNVFANIVIIPMWGHLTLFIVIYGYFILLLATLTYCTLNYFWLL
jgi:hypothetical protein